MLLRRRVRPATTKKGLLEAFQQKVDIESKRAGLKNTGIFLYSLSIIFSFSCYSSFISIVFSLIGNVQEVCICRRQETNIFAVWLPTRYALFLNLTVVNIFSYAII